MKLAKAGDGLAQGIPEYQIFKFFLALGLWIAGWFAISVQIFTRKGFGERYAAVMNLVFGMVGIGLFSGLGNMLISSTTGESLSTLMEWLYTSALAMSVYHRVVIWNSNRKKMIWHSMYSGRPLFVFTGIDEGTLKRWVEPGLLFTLGYFATHSHEHAVGIWLYVGAASVFIHETLAEYMERADMLDRRDAWIESNYKNQLTGNRKPTNQGFSMSPSSITLMKQVPEEEPREFSEGVRSMIDREAEA